MNWLYHRNYVGPNRRSERFQVRFLERRDRAQDPGTRASVRETLHELFARGLKWIDVSSYFGPDRRTGVFSHFFLERRHLEAAGHPPALRAALRQLRVRVLNASSDNGRRALHQRLTATAVLADAQGHPAIGDLLSQLADTLESAKVSGDMSAVLQPELLKAEAMLDHDQGSIR
jgi:hypothetical protein